MQGYRNHRRALIVRRDHRQVDPATAILAMLVSPRTDPEPQCRADGAGDRAEIAASEAREMRSPVMWF